MSGNFVMTRLVQTGPFGEASCVRGCWKAFEDGCDRLIIQLSPHLSFRMPWILKKWSIDLG